MAVITTKKRSRESNSTPEQIKTSEQNSEHITDYADEYELDSSDEEDVRNTVGNIPMSWYNEYAHLGYTIDGKQLLKPTNQGDRIDDFISKKDDPNYWRTVKNDSTGESIVLNDEELDIIENLRGKRFPTPGYNSNEEFVDFHTSEPMIHPMTNRPDDKKTFIPSHSERLKVGRMVHAMKMGWIKPKEIKKNKYEENTFYDLWGDSTEADKKPRIQRLVAPKLPTPGHVESYRPAVEYILSKEEEDEWRKAQEEGDVNDKKSKHRLKFLPQRFQCLRHVPSFARFVNERFERCLDLYLSPRMSKIKANIDAEDLLPELPRPDELRPFPSRLELVYTGNERMVRSIDVDPTGQWLASGSDSGEVRVYEVDTTRCLLIINTGEVVHAVAWSPNANLPFLAVATGSYIRLYNTELFDRLVNSCAAKLLMGKSTTDDLDEENNSDNENCSDVENDSDNAEHTNVKEESTTRGQKAEWSSSDNDVLHVSIKLPYEVRSISWHAGGDYLASVCPESKEQSLSLQIHQISSRKSQCPFKRLKGRVYGVAFHPKQPRIFVMFQRHIREYHLLRQEEVRKLDSNSKFLSSLVVHATGDHLLLGSYDMRVSWIDLDLSSKPYHTLRHHDKGVRSVAFHRSYPLFASGSDDCSLIVCHGRVYSDLLKNPQIVPVKRLRGHNPKNDLGVLQCTFHPIQPWLFSSGSDGNIFLYK